MFLATLNKRRKRLNKVLWAIGLLPGLHLFFSYTIADMTANPFEFLIRQTGHWALVFFTLSYAITPLRRWLRFAAVCFRLSYGKRLADWNFLIYNRRLLGLCSFYYGSAHFFIYMLFELDFHWTEFYFDLNERLFIALGTSGWLGLFILGITSPDWMQKRLKSNWRKVHRLVYLLAPILLAHMIYESKFLEWDIWVYGGLLAAFSLHRILAFYLKVFANKADDGMMVAKR